ncbi:hypothetical protein DXB65_14285 [Bacteroides oleiciplenus]|uniref:Uncharacterized protein n=1 Tax=Bacteroides oleiciplenus TaxID=626931 RepID=A0A3E5B9L1_9BACE|nr:hypothetical protein DXB65_14285 [Bacteroides oleiciplenus]
MEGKITPLWLYNKASNETKKHLPISKSTSTDYIVIHLKSFPILVTFFFAVLFTDMNIFLYLISIWLFPLMKSLFTPNGNFIYILR